MCACGSVTSTLTRRPRDGTTSSGVRTSKSSQPGDRCAAVPDASSNAPTLSLYVSEVRPLPSAPPRACTSAASPRCGHRPSNRSDSSSCVMTSLSTLASMPSASPTMVACTAMQPAPTKSSASLNESGTLPARSRSVLMRLCKRSDTSARHCGVARSGACCRWAWWNFMTTERDVARTVDRYGTHSLRAPMSLVLLELVAQPLSLAPLAARPDACLPDA
mmetsp:Transcript_2582/g.6922  ORF Transcript_2582/g.6922 Transcript_2582/m.6922 type:complete len:219 (-) Transcript_2582:2972-3628(-)